MISREEIRHIYALSKLELKDEEIDVTRENLKKLWTMFLKFSKQRHRMSIVKC